MTRILVADDERDIRDLVEYALAQRGYEVQTCVDGSEALEAILTRPPDLAILDIKMPKMDGLQVTRSVRANKAVKDLPIILFTALGQVDDLLAGQAAGTKYYVVKPFTMAAFGLYIEKVLSESQFRGAV